MSTYKQIFYQIVFGTKNRERTLTEAHCEELYKYIWGVIKKHNCFLYRINGMEEHIHIFSDLNPTISLADYIKDIKVASSLWMKGSGLFPDFKGWQDGYGAFTYSVKEKNIIIDYVKNQKEHHKKESFYDEYRRLLLENGVPFDEKYLL
jgi:REP element-mobilizing transposase RayT